MTTLEEANALVRGIFEEVARLEEHIALLDAAIADHHNQVTHRAPIDLDRARMHAMERNRARVAKIEAGKRLVFTKPERAIFEALSSTTPTLFSDIRVSLHERVKDRALQRLRKRGFVKYLKKSEGGPGWVTNLQPTSKPDDVKRVY